MPSPTNSHTSAEPISARREMQAVWHNKPMPRCGAQTAVNRTSEPEFDCYVGYDEKLWTTKQM